MICSFKFNNVVNIGSNLTVHVAMPTLLVWVSSVYSLVQAPSRIWFGWFGWLTDQDFTVPTCSNVICNTGLMPSQQSPFALSSPIPFPPPLPSLLPFSLPLPPPSLLTAAFFIQGGVPPRHLSPALPKGGVLNHSRGREHSP